MWLHKLLPLSGMGNSDQLLLILFSYASINSTCAQPPSPLPPGPLRGICPPCQSLGWGICKFCTARLLGAGGIDWCIMEGRKWKGKESGLLLFNVSVKRSTSRKGLVHSFPAENIEMTIINAVYSNINFKLSLSVCLPFLKTSFGEISERRRRVYCISPLISAIQRVLRFFSGIYFIKAIENFFPVFA